MAPLTRTLPRCMAMLLIAALLALSAPLASAHPLTPQTVHTRILKRGIGNWVGVELLNGTEFWGRIVSIDDQSFGLQLHNDPAITPVPYDQVVGLHMGISHAAFWAFTAAGVAGAVIFAVVAHHEFTKQEQAAFPAQPAFP